MLEVLEDVVVAPCSLESFLIKDRAVSHALGCCMVLTVDDKATHARADALELGLEDEVLTLVLMIP